ncbi:hypothetical protein PPYR_08060 [Photinus pyralis]|uniref:Phospholipid/glycerol acyltransferase domain-containing protein n=2 Tax=Photinus pyralis TaxID=7054 RepID=A0A5N4AIF7_PHOPY|nr:glycerol-3-phosphate acyltransferase 1, mitochondrial isoform X1 [Photinus pyralis]KAB0797066.1 hypothetical protein PPYR_08060 [Photinus pyralis]
MEGFLEIVFFLGFLYWFWPNLFLEGASRANKMVDIVTSRMFEAVNRFAPVPKQQGDSLSTINDLKRFSSDQRYKRILNRESEAKAREAQLYDIKENVPPISNIKTRPLMGLTCYSCAPVSRDSLVNQSTKNLGLKNILNEYPAIRKKGVLTRTFAHFTQCYEATSYNYAYVDSSILEEERVKLAIEKTTAKQVEESNRWEEEYCEQLLVQNERRAKKLFKDMQSSMSDLLFKLTSWVLYKLLPCFLSSIVVHSGQVKMIKEAGQTGLPLIFLPLHRSHLDYIMISFILFNNNIQCPLIAAGDNLRMPIFGSLLRGLGAFYIRRRLDPVLGQKDYVYKAILHSYMNAGLRAGHNVEFFLEGGRTRTGKPLMPKYGIFSVILDSLMDGTIEDALLVPVSINYEKLVDGNFIREQLGQPKKMETFRSTMRSIWHVLNSNYGMARIDLNQPISLRELMKTFNNGKVQNQVFPKSLRTNPSNSSLYGTDVVSDEYKYLVEKISKHVLYDGARSTSVMSTNAVAYLLLRQFRKGATLDELVAALDELRVDLDNKQKDVGFSGSSRDAILYAVDMLGVSLIKKEVIDDKFFITPDTSLPNVIELNYYSNILVNYYCLEAVIATALNCMDTELGEVSEDELVEGCLDICNLLQYEFIFCKPCQDLEGAIRDCIETLTIYKEIFTPINVDTIEAQKGRKLAEQFFDEDELDYTVAKQLKINDNESVNDYLLFTSSLLAPLIESYSVTAFCMDKLIGQPLPESVLIMETLDEMKEQLGTGSIYFDESVSSDSVKNALKLFQTWDIVECQSEGKHRKFNLKPSHNNHDSIRTLASRIDKYRTGVVSLE